MSPKRSKITNEQENEFKRYYELALSQFNTNKQNINTVLYAKGYVGEKINKNNTTKLEFIKWAKDNIKQSVTPIVEKAPVVTTTQLKTIVEKRPEVEPMPSVQVPTKQEKKKQIKALLNVPSSSIKASASIQEQSNALDSANPTSTAQQNVGVITNKINSEISAIDQNNNYQKISEGIVTSIDPSAAPFIEKEVVDIPKMVTGTSNLPTSSQTKQYPTYRANVLGPTGQVEKLPLIQIRDDTSVIKNIQLMTKAGKAFTKEQVDILAELMQPFINETKADLRQSYIINKAVSADFAKRLDEKNNSYNYDSRLVKQISAIERKKNEYSHLG
jgi:hypothetical protein